MPFLPTLLKRYPIFVGSTLGVGLMGTTYRVFNGIPKYFSGDDYLLLNESSIRDGHASSFFGSVNDLKMGNFRPMFTCTMTPVLKLFGDRYWCYFLLNLALIFMICLLAGNLLQRVFQLTESTVALLVFAVPFSRFAWFGRVSPFGLMEFGALLFALLFIRYFVVAVVKQADSAWYLVGALAFISALFNERYLVLLGAGFLVSILNVRNKRIPIPIDPWLVFSCTFLALREYQLRTHPLVGGGEGPPRSLFDTWVFEHFLVGLKAVAGIGNGTNIVFDASGLVRLPALSAFGMLWFVALTLIVLVVFVLKATHLRGVSNPKNLNSSEIENHLTVMRQLLLSCGLLLIIPASTTINRIEARWLFGPEIFLLMFLIAALRSEKSRTILISGLLLFNVACLKFLPDYEHQMNLSNEVLEYVHEKLDGQTQLVYTIVDPRSRPELTSWLDWQMGEGNLFKQIGVKSAVNVDKNLCSGSCIKITFADTERIDFVSS